MMLMQESLPKMFAMFAPSASGGHPRYVRHVLDALADSNAANNRFNFVLLASQDLRSEFNSDRYMIERLFAPIRDKQTFSNLALWAINRFIRYYKIYFQTAAWLSKNRNCDFVHLQEVNGLPTLIFVQFVKKILRRKIIITVHNIFPHRYPPIIPRSIIHLVLRSIYRTADITVVHTARLKDVLHNFIGNAQSQLPVIAVHGVWTDDLSELHGDSAATNRPSLRILAFGVLRANKNFDIVASAMSILADRGIYPELTIAGAPDDMSYFKRVLIPAILAAQANGARITLISEYIEKEQAGKLFNNADVVVLPYSNFAAQSGVIFDALAFGLPVIVSDAGGLAETVTDLGIGRVLPSLLPETLAEVLGEFCRAGNTLAELKDIVSIARSRCTWEAHAVSIIAALKSR